MILIKQVGDFIVSSWIWQFTADWFHPIFTGIIMFLLVRFTMRRTRFRSFLIALCAQLVALAVLCFLALGLFVHLFGWEFDIPTPYEGITRIALFWPSVGLAILYAIFQTCFFYILSFIWRINLLGYIIIVWMSNGIGAMLSYVFIHMSEVMKYIG